jgi:hypothetical protein
VERIASEKQKGVVMSNQGKHPNAYKHGIFNRAVIVPGENQEEFEALHRSLITEWMPNGATEEDAVLSIAEAMWRKHRARRFIEFQFLKNTTDPRLPCHNEILALSHLVAVLREQPNIVLHRDRAERSLTPDILTTLQLKFPDTEFESTAEWTQAVINHIETVLLPARMLSDRISAEALPLLMSTSAFTGELFDQELMLEARIDAMIDRAIKRLIQTKAMKQMLGPSVTERTSGQSGKVEISHARQ